MVCARSGTQFHTNTSSTRFGWRSSPARSFCNTQLKLNATAEMLPISWPEISKLHPFAPVEQAAGYLEIFRQLEGWLAEITGFAAVSLQPNAGSQGEFAGLLAIREYHASRGQAHRNIC